MGNGFGYRPVLDTSRNHAYFPPAEEYRFGIPHLNPELPVPAQEQLVFFMMMPRELAFEPGDPHYSVVDSHQIGRLPRPG